MRPFIFLLALLCSLSCKAQTSPEGLWMSFDDDGKLVGLLFLEDILEELVGEVQDATRRD